jgi:hypothetical protein
MAGFAAATNWSISSTVPDSAMPVLVPIFVQNIPTKMSEVWTSSSLIACCGLTLDRGVAFVSHFTGSKTTDSDREISCLGPLGRIFKPAQFGDEIVARRRHDWLVRFVGLFDSEVRSQLFELGKVRRPSSGKAEKELGWSSRPLEDTIMDTATRLKTVGALS